MLQTQSSPSWARQKQHILGIDSSEPQVNDEVAVTGFKGNVWFNGAIVSTKQSRGKQVFKVIFPFDGATSDCPLKESRYGPAKVTPAYGSKPAQVTPGWLLLAKEAEEPTAGAQQSNGGGSALDSAGGGVEPERMESGLLTLVFETICGGSDTITKLKLASLYSVGDVKLCSKPELRELGISVGNANRFIAAVSKKH